MNPMIESTLDDLIYKIENGTGDWIKEWVGGGAPTNYATKAHYHGVNILLLWSAKQEHCYPTNRWATYKQWSAAGYQVSKGQRSSIIFISKDAVKKGGDKQNPEDRYRLFTCAYVFNEAQLDEAPPQAVRAGADNTPIEACERTLAATGAQVIVGDSPYYTYAADFIEVPDINSFISAETYYVTAFHELVHWTGNPKRLDRNMILDYAQEELVAEFGAAFLAAEHGLTELNENSAAYIRGWLKKVKMDKGRALIQAASAASKAVEFIMSKCAKEEKAA